MRTRQGARLAFVHGRIVCQTFRRLLTFPRRWTLRRCRTCRRKYRVGSRSMYIPYPPKPPVVSAWPSKSSNMPDVQVATAASSSGDTASCCPPLRSTHPARTKRPSRLRAGRASRESRPGGPKLRQRRPPAAKSREMHFSSIPQSLSRFARHIPRRLGQAKAATCQRLRRPISASSSATGERRKLNWLDLGAPQHGLAL